MGLQPQTKSLLVVGAISGLIAGAVGGGLVWLLARPDTNPSTPCVSASGGLEHPSASEQSPDSKQPANQEGAPQAPGAVEVPRTAIVISHDLFARQWVETGNAETAKTLCWAKLPNPPESVTFNVTVDREGAVSEITPEGFTERGEGTKLLAELHHCIAELIRTMRFAKGPGGQSVVQANRP